MTLTTKPTGIIRSTSRAISNVADTVVSATELANTTLSLANKYLTAELVQADENIKVSGAINHAENIGELMRAFNCTLKQAEDILK